ncbi:hypothetical protein [Pelagibius sp. Alg239-R121]|uniref:hypothetical protein n=1 Tax=Pelagibius sp. Alg239-R121 TaxID=2993448 RepID=UPI0024A70EBA|nr:hypothetical protein [Pelagibius sp. Alg239-R121]
MKKAGGKAKQVLLVVIPSLIAFFLPGLSAQACGPAVVIEFLEGAPEDSFEIRNVSAGSWSLTSLKIQLAGSKGDLVFDTAPGGEGVSVFQPFQARASDVRLIEAPVVHDGARVLDLEFAAFWSGKNFDFTIDLDDRLPVSEYGQTQVSGAEIEGAIVIAAFVDKDGVHSVQKGAFGSDARAVLNGGTCA